MSESPRKDLRFKVRIKVYGQGLDTRVSHGYCVDDQPFSISPPIGELFIDVRSVTLKQLRPMIQYSRSGHQDKRSMMFQEALFIMSRLPNYYDRPELELQKYVFAFAKKDGSEVKMISPNRESEPIASLIGATDFFIHDLVLVPLSQIPKDLEESLNQQFLPGSTGDMTASFSNTTETSVEGNALANTNSSSIASSTKNGNTNEVNESPIIAVANNPLKSDGVEVSISRGKSRTRASLESARDTAKKIEK